MLISKNDIIAGKHGKPILMDYGFVSDGKAKPVVVFAHGFKGFKDWGHFNKMMEYVIEQGFAFVKFNFSHNGGTIEQPIDFPDLEAFGNNNYTKELDDLRSVIDWIEVSEHPELDKSQIHLIGHSRGGGIAILASHEDNRIKKVITWAAVSDLINRFPQEQLNHWKEQGVIYIENGRTNQQMPLYYQLAEDTLANPDRFNIEMVAKQLSTPHLIIHGTDDESVFLDEAHKISEWNTDAELFIVDGAGHTFGAVHPYELANFPDEFQVILDKSLNFIKK